MKVNIAKKVQNKEGFTLVELMIVVAIIGILAAIAIPQFAAYRIRGFNTSALNDTRNLMTSEAAYFADQQLYAFSGAAATAVNTPGGAIITGGAGVANAFITQWIGGADRPIPISIGNQVTAIAVGNATGTTANVFGKHFQGDTTYGADSDVSLTYQNAGLIALDTALAAGNAVGAGAAGVDDIAAAGGQWVIK